MEEVAEQESSKHFTLRAGVVEDARSNLVLMSVKPSSAFEGFSGVALSEEDCRRSPYRPRMFKMETVVRKKFSGPISSQGKRVWRTKRLLEAKVVGLKTNKVSRRHWYQLQWKADKKTIRRAQCEVVVDEGYLERHACKNTP